MTCVGIMASAVVTGGACTDVLMEPFTTLTAWSTSGASLVTGRTGNAVSLTGAGTAAYTLPTINRSYNATIGFAYQVSSIGTVIRKIFSFRDSAGSYFATLGVNLDGSLGFYGGDVALSFGTSAASLIAANTWYYLEVQIFIADSGGSFTVRRNATTVISGSGMDTQTPGTPASPIAEVLLRNISGQTCKFDDLYLSTGSGCTFKGDITIP